MKRKNEMRKDKRKLASLLLAIACVSCGAGGIVASGGVVNATNITAKTAINTATVKSAVEKLFDDATSLMDAIATKAEWDTSANTIKAEAKATLENYKDATLYRENEQIIANGRRIERRI